MSLQEMQNYTYFAKYARHNKKERRRETWEEAVDRMMQMHLRRYPQAKDQIEWAFGLVRDKRVLGSQRALQFGGTPIERKHARIYNCCVSFCDRLRFFQEAFWLLLCGCGTGFSVQRHHVAKLPGFSEARRELAREMRGPLSAKKFLVPDTIEGWADALGVLLSSYFENPLFPQYANVEVEFDYSLIRPEGSPLSSATGKAPGHKPLMRSLEKIRGLLERCVYARQDRLRPIDAYDIVMHASDAVLSGGVRRSATICVFSKDDEEMIRAKTGNWFYENPQRARSNNSVLILRNETTKEEFDGIMKSVREFGEPGFVFADSTELLLNPCCFDPNTRIATESGLLRIEDLYKAGTANRVVSDIRVGKNDGYDGTTTGVTTRNASPVMLTQKNADVYEVVTSHGNVLRVTANHKFPTPDRGRLELRDLRVGDSLLLQSGVGKFGELGSYKHGLLAGLVTGDGTVCGEDVFVDIWGADFESADGIELTLNSFDEVREKYAPYKWVEQAASVNGVKKKRMGGRRLRKVLENVGINPATLKSRVPESVWQGSWGMVAGYIHGLIFTDGSIQYTDRGKKSSLSLRITQSNKALLEDVQALLLNLGVVSRLYKRSEAGPRSMPDGRDGLNVYECEAVYELIVNRPNLVKLWKSIGIFGRKGDSAQRLLDVCGWVGRKKENYRTTIKSIAHVGKSDVYCLEEPEANCLIANGVVTGNCEIGMWPVCVKTGLSGWQMCNLSTINGKLVKTRHDFLEAATAAAIIGTLQAGYADFPYLGKVTEDIVKQEALLGVSITGMMDSPDLLFNPELQREAAGLVAFTNRRVAELLGINPAARCTAIKPEGTTSCMLGTASGIHPHHARRYFRRIQANRMEHCHQLFAKHNPGACEDSVWSANKTDSVMTFCVEIPEGAKTKADIDAVTLLRYVQLTQQNWIASGKEPRLCTQPWLSHNVSNTINVRPDEWAAVADYIYANRQYFTAVSLLSMSGDKDYPQAPFCAVLDDAELRTAYGDALPTAERLVDEAVAAFAGNLWGACEAALGNQQTKYGTDQEVWVREMESFAQSNFAGNVKEATYCLKDVFHWREWQRLTASYRPVDYSLMVEETDETAPLETIACAGGACELR